MPFNYQQKIGQGWGHSPSGYGGNWYYGQGGGTQNKNWNAPWGGSRPKEDPYARTYRPYPKPFEQGPTPQGYRAGGGIGTGLRGGGLGVQQPSQQQYEPQPVESITAPPPVPPPAPAPAPVQNQPSPPPVDPNANTQMFDLMQQMMKFFQQMMPQGQPAPTSGQPPIGPGGAPRWDQQSQGGL